MAEAQSAADKPCCSQIEHNEQFEIQCDEQWLEGKQIT